MKDKELARVMDQVKLSRERENAILANLLREKKEAANMKNTGKRGFLAVALAAAALVVILAGTALAESYRVRLKVTPVDNFENGYQVTAACPNIPAERLSEEALERAAQARVGRDGPDELRLGSWEEAEEFLGLEIADNPMLEEMARSEWTPPHEGDATPEEVRACTVQTCVSNGLPSQIMLYTGYFGDYFEDGPFGVNVFATLQIKAPGEGDTLVSKGIGGKLENVREEKYVTPSGLEVTIIAQEGTVTRAADGSTFQDSFYTAYFVLNNALFGVSTHFNEENADVRLGMLKQVLDAYE